MRIIIFACIFSLLVTCQAYDFTSSEYQSKKRCQKLSSLWKAIKSDTNRGRFPTTQEFQELFNFSMSDSLNFEGDTMPGGRQKLLHSVGIVAKAEFIPEPDNHYTGLFQGADSVLIRFSLSKQANYTKKEAKYAYNNFAPGVSLKFLIDSKPSANVFALFSVNGVNSFNFFDQEMHTHFPAAEGAPLNKVLKKFASATKVVRNVGLKRLSEYKQDGCHNQNSKFPFKLSFVAPKDIKDKFTNDFTVEYQETFSTFPPGTTILDVYATEDPESGCRKKIGTLKTKSHFTSTKFGDEKLFFQHQDFSLDLKVHPEWNPYTPFFNFLNNGDPQKPEGGCPFSRML